MLAEHGQAKEHAEGEEMRAQAWVLAWDAYSARRREASFRTCRVEEGARGGFIFCRLGHGDNEQAVAHTQDKTQSTKERGGGTIEDKAAIVGVTSGLISTSFSSCGSRGAD